MDSQEGHATRRLCATCGLALAEDATICSGCGEVIVQPAREAAYADTPRMTCQWCGAENPVGSDTCAACGARFPRREYDAELERQAAQRKAQAKSAPAPRKRGLLTWLFG